MSRPTPKAFTALLQDAINEPGTLSQAYQQFHTYSLGNQLLAMFQCHGRGLKPGPMATFPRWKELGRHVRKGEKALTLCMPITIKRNAETTDDGTEESIYTRFVYKSRWFVLSQTDGEPLPESESPDWNAARALDGLDVQEIPFDHVDGKLSRPRPGPPDRHQSGQPAAPQDTVPRARPRPARPHRRRHASRQRRHAAHPPRV